MEQTVEHVRVNLNKELWRIDYAAGIAKHLRGGITINDDKSAKRYDNKTSPLEGVAGYNGDITQYLQDKGYVWEQLDEDSVKFRREKELKDEQF